MMGACGLDCTTCEIRTALTDSSAASVLVDWLRSQGLLSEAESMPEVLDRGLYCTGCLGSRATHWSSDCWILNCCVDDKGLRDCAQCDTFPCARLADWASQNDSYAQALSALRRLRAPDAQDLTL